MVGRLWLLVAVLLLFEEFWAKTDGVENIDKQTIMAKAGKLVWIEGTVTPGEIRLWLLYLGPVASQIVQTFAVLSHNLSVFLIKLWIEPLRARCAKGRDCY